MQAHPDWQVLNRGVNGERSDQIRARFARDVGDSEADGRGDHRRRQRRLSGTQRRRRSNASSKRCTTPARAAKIAVVAGTHHPVQHGDARTQNARMHAVNDWIRGYAAGHAGDVVFCDTRAAVAAPGQPDRLVSSPDDLHPSPDGYKRMADSRSSRPLALALAEGTGRCDKLTHGILEADCGGRGVRCSCDAGRAARAHSSRRSRPAPRLCRCS